MKEKIGLLPKYKGVLMRKIFLLSLMVLLLLAGCKDEPVDAAMDTPIPTYPAWTAENSIENLHIPLTLEELDDVSDWEWQEEYGYYIADNGRWDYLTIWYDPHELSYSLKHPYSSLSDEHIANGTKVYPINRHYTNENGNTFIPFVFTDLKHPDYEDDGDGVYWLLYENFNGLTFLEYFEWES